MNTLPQEVVQAIFEAGCDLEFEQLPQLEEHTNFRWFYFEGPMRSQRYLKPFAHLCLRVCKDWKTLVEHTSTLWISTLLNTASNCRPLPSEILDETQDDLVVSLTLRTYDESIEWFKTQIIPLSHRLHKLLIIFFDVHCAPPLFVMLNKIHFPRLLGLTLNFEFQSGHLDFPEIWTPNVRSLNIKRVPWNPLQASFRSLFGLELIQHHEMPFGSTSTALVQSISPSSQTLVYLSINLSDRINFGETEGITLQLPQLSKLHLVTSSVGMIVRILEIIIVPVLRDLNLRTAAAIATSGPATYPRIDQMPVRELDFSSVQNMVIEMPANCPHHVFGRVKVYNLEVLTLHICNLVEQDFFHNESIPKERITFSKLRTLHMTWQTYTHGEFDLMCVEWFFGIFDFSRTREHASICLNSPYAISRLDFPYLQRYSVISRQFPSHISAPALTHLCLPSASLCGKDTWKIVRSNLQIPFHKITALELGMMPTNIRSTRDVNTEIFKSFTKVTTLLITHVGSFISTDVEKEYGWPTCWTSSKRRLFKNGSVVFPKLDTLQVTIPETRVHNPTIEKIIEEIGLFLKARRKQGHPIRTLLLNYIPPAWFGKITKLAQEVKEFRLINYSHEDGLQWLIAANRCRCAICNPY
jgi:hypothetical protein